MQYSSFHDINGQRICEGDIIKHTLTGKKLEVKVFNGRFVAEGDGNIVRLYEISSRSTIVGNIFGIEHDH